MQTLLQQCCRCAYAICPFMHLSERSEVEACMRADATAEARASRHARFGERVLKHCTGCFGAQAGGAAEVLPRLSIGTGNRHEAEVCMQADATAQAPA